MTQASLKDGIPPLFQTITLLPPSVPSEEDHASVENFEVRNFGVMPLAEFEQIFDQFSRSWLDVRSDGYVHYASENDVASLVNGLVKDIAKAMGLHLETFTEVGAFGVRSDVWVVSWNCIPIGVIEVKKPQVEGNAIDTNVLDEPTVLGELYDFQMQLPNFYGMRPAFGILTTFETWRVCWIPHNTDVNVDVDEIAETSESLPNTMSKFITPKKKPSEKRTSPPGHTPSKTNPVIHSIESEEMTIEDASHEEEDRALHVSRIYTREDGDHLAMRAIAAVLCKMMKATKTVYGGPFDNLTKRMVLRFTRGESRSFHWCRMGKLEGAGKWNKYANPEKYLYAIEDLGKGADGRVWLTCTCSGAVCVLKFPLVISKRQGKNIMEREMENWNAVYPGFRVFRETWCGRDALRMPHFAAVEPDRRLAVIKLVEATLRANFASNGLVHEDVAWRNIGLYRVGTEECAVAYDLGRVGKQAPDGDDSWVTTAIEKLKREA